VHHQPLDHNQLLKALDALDRTLDSAPAVDDALGSAREQLLQRDRERLRRRLRAAAVLLGQLADPVAVRDEVRRLVLDVEHHLQRVNDLAYDTVAMEVGGSE